MGSMDLEIKIDISQDKIEKIKHQIEIELDTYKQLPVHKLRNSQIKFIVTKVMSEIHGAIAVGITGKWDDDPSDQAKINLTTRVLTQWQFLEESLHSKETELIRIQTLYKDLGLPNYSDEENKRISEICMLTEQIAKHKDYVRELQKNELIHTIIWD